MADAQVQEFARYLAAITDADERRRAIVQVQHLAVNQAPDEAFEAPIRTLGQYLLDDIEVPPVLVHPYIVVRAGITATIGRAGKGKTVMNLNRLMRWAAGLPMFEGWTDGEGTPMLVPDRPLKILVIENEGAGGLFHRQVGIMLNSHFLADDERDLVRENLLVWGDGGYSGLKLDDPSKLDGVRAGVEQWEPDIVFVEPFRGLWAGEENSSTDMTKVVDALVQIGADYQCGVMLAHHERKSGVGEDGEKMSAGRGSTVLEGAVSVMENFEGVKGGDYRELSWSKSRHGQAPNTVRMQWVPDQWWYEWVPMDSIGETIMSALKNNADEPMTVKDLHEATDESTTRLRPALDKLVKDNRLKKMASDFSGAGSTGIRYRLPTGDNGGEEFGGLSVG
jgi:hypothetical protein